MEILILAFKRIKAIAEHCQQKQMSVWERTHEYYEFFTKTSNITLQGISFV